MKFIATNGKIEIDFSMTLEEAQARLEQLRAMRTKIPDGRPAAVKIDAAISSLETEIGKLE